MNRYAFLFALCWFTTGIFGTVNAKAPNADIRKTLPVMQGWKLWRDSSASWQNDSLYLPQDVDLFQLALDAPEPTGGWQTLNKLPADGFIVNLPAIVEEYFTPDGKTTTSMPGVYWFWKDLDIPANWKDKIIRLNIESYRLRMEVFANSKLVGYDIVDQWLATGHQLQQSSTRTSLLYYTLRGKLLCIELIKKLELQSQ
ncbi:hypothetical protein FACS1894160_4230 [Bacteroidia bacterium]|nr:hypothetical protein FACS1894160_4230 [Bacteroidia bacterium]